MEPWKPSFAADVKAQSNTKMSPKFIDDSYRVNEKQKIASFKVRFRLRKCSIEPNIK